VSNQVDVYYGTASMDVTTMHAAVLYLVYMQIQLRDHWRKKLEATRQSAYASWNEERARLQADGIADENLPPEPDYDADMKRIFDGVGAVALPDYLNSVFGMRQAYQNPNLRVGAAQSLIQLLSQIRAGPKVQSSQGSNPCAARNGIRRDTVRYFRSLRRRLHVRSALSRHCTCYY
jgi:hypothetical protein